MTNDKDKLESLRNFSQYSRAEIERNEDDGYGSFVKHWEDVNFLLDLFDKRDRNIG